MSRNMFTLEAFADFCDKQGEATFDYEFINFCACGEYAASLGIRHWYMSSSFWIEANRMAREVSKYTWVQRLINGSLYNRQTKYSDLAAHIRKHIHA